VTTLFPAAYDDFLNPTSGTQLSATGYKHHQHHTDLNDAVEALEHVLGTPGVTSGTVYSLVSISGALTTLSSTVVTGMQVLSSVTTTVSGLVTTVSGTVSGAPLSGSYLTLSAVSGVPYRVMSVSGSLSGTDAGSGTTYTVRDLTTGVATGTYYNPVITVNSYGKLTFASDSGDQSGLVRGLPPAPRYVASFWFGDYITSLDKVYFTTKIATGSIYYIDRTTDLPVLVATISGKTPGAWIYSSILTGFVGSNTAVLASGWVCTVTGGSVVGSTFSCDGGLCTRTTVTGKTIYSCSNANNRVEVFDPATLTTTNTIANGAGGTDGRSIIFISGSDSVYSIRRTDGDIFKVYCPTTGSVTLSGLGSSLGSRCALTYNANANRAFACGDTANKVGYFTPAAGSGTETVTTLNFPPGASGSSGALGIYSCGNYVYISTNISNPPYMLVLDAVNLIWKYPLQIAESSSTITFDRPSFMAGVAAENLLYVGISNSASIGYYAFGRFS
jgi:hypothetical protein